MLQKQMKFCVGDLVRFAGWSDPVNVLDDHKMDPGTLGIVIQVTPPVEGEGYLMVEEYLVCWPRDSAFWMYENEMELVNGVR